MSRVVLGEFFAKVIHIHKMFLRGYEGITQISSGRTIKKMMTIFS